MRRFIVFFSYAALGLGTGLAIYLNRSGDQSKVVDERTRVPASTDSQPRTSAAAASKRPELSGLPSAKAVGPTNAPTPSVIDQYWKSVTGPLSPEAAAAFREQRQNFKKEQAARSNRIKEFRGPGKPVRFNHESDKYELVGRLRALPEKEFSPSMGFKVIDQAGGYVFLELGPDDLPPHNSVPVAVNASTQVLGAMTGLYAVKLEDLERVSELATEFKLQLVHTFDAIQTVFVRSDRSTGEDLVSLLEQIRKDPRVKRADLEIMERLNEPR